MSTMDVGVNQRWSSALEVTVQGQSLVKVDAATIAVAAATTTLAAAVVVLVIATAVIVAGSVIVVVIMVVALLSLLPLQPRII